MINVAHGLMFSGTFLWLLVGTGCVVVRAPVVPPVAAVYTNVSAPLDADFDETELGTRGGAASSISILGLISLGDAGVRAAAENGGITTIRGADYEFLLVLFGLYTRYTTVVYGD